MATGKSKHLEAKGVCQSAFCSAGNPGTQSLKAKTTPGGWKPLYSQLPALRFPDARPQECAGCLGKPPRRLTSVGLG